VSDEQNAWRVGDLAAATGLTVRTLYHYELDRHQRPATSALLDLIQRTTEVDRLVTQYLDADQLTGLGRAHTELGARATGIVTVELPALYRRALAEYETGTDPADPVVRAIAADIDRLSARLGGGSSSGGHGVRRMWAERGEEIHPGHGIPWAAIVACLDAAREASGD
jgi:hypothetical protein